MCLCFANSACVCDCLYVNFVPVCMRLCACLFRFLRLFPLLNRFLSSRFNSRKETIKIKRKNRANGAETRWGELKQNEQNRKFHQTSWRGERESIGMREWNENVRRRRLTNNAHFVQFVLSAFNFSVLVQVERKNVGWKSPSKWWCRTSKQCCYSHLHQMFRVWNSVWRYEASTLTWVLMWTG